MPGRYCAAHKIRIAHFVAFFKCGCSAGAYCPPDRMHRGLLLRMIFTIFIYKCICFIISDLAVSMAGASPPASRRKAYMEEMRCVYGFIFAIWENGKTQDEMQKAPGCKTPGAATEWRQGMREQDRLSHSFVLSAMAALITAFSTFSHMPAFLLPIHQNGDPPVFRVLRATLRVLSTRANLRPALHMICAGGNRRLLRHS